MPGTDRGPGVADVPERYARNVVTSVAFAPCFEEPRFLLLGPVDGDADGSERVTADIELRMRQGAKRRRQLLEFLQQQGPWSCCSERRQQTNLEGGFLEQSAMTGIGGQGGVDELFCQHTQHIDWVCNIGADENLISRVIRS